MGSSFLSEVDDTSILRTGALHCYHYPLSSLPASRLLLPRSGLERSDFVHWHFSDLSTPLTNVGYQGKNGSNSDIAKSKRLTLRGRRDVCRAACHFDSGNFFR